MTVRTYGKVVGGIIVGLLLLFVLIIGGKAVFHEITKERPHYNTGTVIEREYVPAHTDLVPQQQYVGEDCSYDSYTKSESCSARYITVFVNEFVPDDWNIRIENCHVLHKNGDLWVDKQGNAKCFHKWIDVDHETYNSFKIGDNYA